MTLTQCLDCGKDVSTSAISCPNCGRPAENHSSQLQVDRRIACPDGRCTGTIGEEGTCGTCGKTTNWKDDEEETCAGTPDNPAGANSAESLRFVLGGLGIFIIFAWICLFYLGKSNPLSSPKFEAAPSPKNIGPMATQEESLRNEAERQAILKADWDTQGGAILTRVRGLIKKKQYDAAVREANPFLPVGGPELTALHDQAQAVILEREREAKEKIESAAKQVNREKYAALLREIYLELGLDIGVRISGKQSDELILSYVFFNDVWVHRFQKDGNFAEWRELGFKRVHIMDGYNYHKSWTF